MELQFKYPGLWLVNANLNNGISTQISLILMELQLKYPGLWLVNANLNNGISTQISLILRIKTQITESQFKYPVMEWNGVEHVVMNIDESVFRMPIYSVQANYIVMNIDESVFCIHIYSVQGRYNPDLWLDKATLLHKRFVIRIRQ